jgi:phosphoribosylformylglycinamidine (FGAM) synthase PurS component
MTLALAVGALFLLAINLLAIRKAGELQARLEAEEKARERADRMAAEMLKERTVEDVARDLDSGQF